MAQSAAMADIAAAAYKRQEMRDSVIAEQRVSLTVSSFQPGQQLNQSVGWGDCESTREMAPGLPWLGTFVLKDFVTSLGVQRGQDWVAIFAQKEFMASRQDPRRRQAARSLQSGRCGTVRSCATRLVARTVTALPKDPGERMRMAVGYLLRRLDEERMSKGTWRQTSRTGADPHFHNSERTMAASMPLTMSSSGACADTLVDLTTAKCRTDLSYTMIIQLLACACTQPSACCAARSSGAIQ